VESFAREVRLLAPKGGDVIRLNAQPGELIGPGFPIVTLRDDDRYLVLNLREDRLGGIRIGQRLLGQIPALDMASVEFEIDRIGAQADFATVRATNASPPAASFSGLPDPRRYWSSCC
jgi:HlyD family secretion protein